MPIVVPPQSQTPAGVESIVWIDPDGVETILTAQPDLEVDYGVEGRFMPPVSFVEEEVPDQPGARLRETKIRPRDVALPVTIIGANGSALRTRLRQLLHTLNPVRGDGRLKVTAPDGSQRQLTCRYAGGLQVVEEFATHVVGWQRAVVVFRAFDPWWYDAADLVQTFTTTTPAVFFPFFPLRLSASEVFADTPVNNDGDSEAWPVWTITGPGTNPVLRNLTSGKSTGLTLTLAAGETATVDTRPGRKTITRSDGTNLYAQLVDGAALWPLLRGNNALRIELSTATTASSVQLTYKRRWLGA